MAKQILKVVGFIALVLAIIAVLFLYVVYS
jgi:hypothetical protein